MTNGTGLSVLGRKPTSPPDQRVSGVTMDGLQAFDCFRLEVGLEVWDRSANQPAGSVGDLGQSCLVLFFEAAEVTEAVGCHHRLRCGPVKQLQQSGAGVERLHPLHQVQALVALRQEGHGVRGSSPTWRR